MKTSSRESESTLVILSEHPEAVADEIAGLTSVGSYLLLPQGSTMIHDTYFGVSDRELIKKSMALRVREIGSTRLITLKGPAQATDWGGIERSETEVPWSRDALSMIMKQLTDAEVEIPQQASDFENVHPSDVMASLGFRVIQDRVNRRRINNIAHSPDETGTVLAEMAVDSVAYHFSSQDIRHYEVEIEAKSDNGSEAVSAVIEGLIDIYGPALRRWNYGKLTTGGAIEEMLAKGTLEGLIDPGNNLRPVAYRLIDYYLRRGRRRRI
jgi:uncharacterized protein YjbK